MNVDAYADVFGEVDVEEAGEAERDGEQEACADRVAHDAADKFADRVGQTLQADDGANVVVGQEQRCIRRRRRHRRQQRVIGDVVVYQRGVERRRRRRHDGLVAQMRQHEAHRLARVVEEAVRHVQRDEHDHLVHAELVHCAVLCATSISNRTHVRCSFVVACMHIYISNNIVVPFSVFFAVVKLPFLFLLVRTNNVQYV